MVQIYKMNSRKGRNSYQNKSIASMAEALRKGEKNRPRAQTGKVLII
jgi:hypothetical protein